MWACRICKGVIYAALAVLLFLAIKAVLTGGALGAIFSKLGASAAAGKSGYAAWTAFIAWLGAKFSVEGKELAGLGYTVFSGILTACAIGLYALSDLVAWIVCLFCRALGACDECEKPDFLK